MAHRNDGPKLRDCLKPIERIILSAAMQTNHLKLSLLLACLYQSACTNEPSSAVLELNNPISTRMELVDFEDWQYQVNITVNSESPQTFLFAPNDTDLSVVIVGVQPNEQNSIEIRWNAIIDGINVELSQQSQVFFADGNTLIDAPHNHEQYDFDGDEVSNLFELAAGTCLWSVTEPCLHPDFTVTDTNNIFLNGDFSNGTDQWWSTRLTGEVVDGEYCLSVLPFENVGVFWHFGHLPRFELKQNTRYSLSFYARSQTLTEINVSVNLPELDFFEVFESDLEVFSTFNQYNFQFDTTNRNYEQSEFVFNIDPDLANTFCFDDIVLEEVN